MSGSNENGFVLDPRLAADSVFVADWNLTRVLLMDDARFPWLILVPRRASAAELDDLAMDEQSELLHEINRAMSVLRSIASCDKLNVGLLGNIVRQLHVHVVARREGDAAWPGPAWGSGVAMRHAADARDALVDRLRAAS